MSDVIDESYSIARKIQKLSGELQENLQYMIMEMQDKRQQQFKQEYSKLKEKYGGEFKLFEDMTKDQLAKEKREGNTATDDNNGNYYSFITDSEPNNVMHIHSIDMWYEPVKKKFNIFTKVKIVDASSNPVEGAAVYIETTLPNGETISDNDVTDSAGFVTFVYGPTPKRGTYTSTVTNVAKGGWTYNPDENVETSENIYVS